MQPQPVTLPEFARLWLAVRLATAEGQIAPPAFHALKAHFGDIGGDAVTFRRLMALAERQQGTTRRMARMALQGLRAEDVEALFFRLAHIARAAQPSLGSQKLIQLDGVLRATKMRALSRWRLLFEIRRERNPHMLLGAGPRLSRSHVRKVYHRLAREYHPDGLQGYGYGHGDMARMRHCLQDAMQGYQELYRPALPNAA